MLKREMPPVHPGTVLKELYLEPLEISVTDFAGHIGVARRTVSLLVNGHSGVSAEMALRLSKALGTTPALWLDMQQKYDLWNADKKINLVPIKYLQKETLMQAAEPPMITWGKKAARKHKGHAPKKRH